MPRDLTPATRGIPATAEAWASRAADLKVLTAIVIAERALYGRVTDKTAAMLADFVVKTEAAVVIQAAQMAARGVQS